MLLMAGRLLSHRRLFDIGRTLPLGPSGLPPRHLRPRVTMVEVVLTILGQGRVPRASAAADLDQSTRLERSG